MSFRSFPRALAAVLWLVDRSFNARVSFRSFPGVLAAVLWLVNMSSNTRVSFRSSPSGALLELLRLFCGLFIGASIRE